jgi:hypothetical protein
MSQEVKDFVKHAQTHLLVDPGKDGWYLCWPDGERYGGPYARPQDARRALTMMGRDVDSKV